VRNLVSFVFGVVGKVIYDGLGRIAER